MLYFFLVEIEWVYFDKSSSFGIVDFFSTAEL